MFNPRNRKMMRMAILLAGLLLIILIVADWWFQRNALSLIKAFVEKESRGEYKIDIRRLKIHYLHPPRVELFDTDLHVFDSAGRKLLYDIHVNHLALQGKSLRNLVFGKTMLVDYIVVKPPGWTFTASKKRKRQRRAHHFHDKLGI